MPNWSASDEAIVGEEVSLWQFCGQVIVLDFSTMWCGPCGTLAEDVDHTWKQFRDEGFMYITVLTQNDVSQIPDNEDLNTWVDTYDITAPVLSDVESYSNAILPNNAFLSIEEAEKLRPVFEAGNALGAHFFIHPGRRPDQVPPLSLSHRAVGPRSMSIGPCSRTRT